MLVKFLSWCCGVDIPELIHQNILLRTENKELRTQLNIKENTNITYTSTLPYIELLGISWDECIKKAK